MIRNSQRGQVLAFVALAFCVISFVPLGIIFEGCTSTSSASKLYFLKMDLTSFPRLDALHLRRSDVIGGVDNSKFADNTAQLSDSATKIAAGSISKASNAADSGINQVESQVQSLTDDIKSHIPAYYAVGLRSYCQENRGDKSYTNCSRVSNTFSFDPLAFFGSFVDEIDALLPQEAKRPLEAYGKASHFAISAYIIFIVVNCLTILSGATWYISQRNSRPVPALLSEWSKALTLLSATLSSIFLLCASAIMTAIYVSVQKVISRYLLDVGISASLGGLLVATWIAEILSLLACGLFYGYWFSHSTS